MSAAVEAQGDLEAVRRAVLAVEDLSFAADAGRDTRRARPERRRARRPRSGS